MGALYQRYSDSLWHHVHRRSGGDRGFADDVTAETWETVVETITTKYDPSRSSFVTWLYLRADSIGKSRQRRQGTGWVKEVRAHLLAHGYSEAAQDRGPDELAVLRDESAMLAKAMGRLTKVQRESLLLTRFEGLTNKEAAQVLGITEGAVKSALFKGLTSLRKMILPPHGIPEVSPRVQVIRRSPSQDPSTTTS